MVYGTPLLSGLYPTCSENVFRAYHDPNVHIFLSAVFGVFAVVFFYYTVTRRPKWEYFWLMVFSICTWAM